MCSKGWNKARVRIFREYTGIQKRKMIVFKVKVKTQTIDNFTKMKKTSIPQTKFIKYNKKAFSGNECFQMDSQYRTWAFYVK